MIFAYFQSYKDMKEKLENRNKDAVKVGLKMNASKTCGSVVVKALGIDPLWCRWGFFSEATDGTLCPGVDSAYKNEYKENSWG